MADLERLPVFRRQIPHSIAEVWQNSFIDIAEVGPNILIRRAQ